MICTRCGARPVPPSNLSRQYYRCSWCRNNTPAALARRARYAVTDKRKAVMKRMNARRIWVGHEYHSHAPSMEAADVIRAHVKQARRAFFATDTGGPCRSVETAAPKRN